MHHSSITAPSTATFKFHLWKNVGDGENRVYIFIYLFTEFTWILLIIHDKQERKKKPYLEYGHILWEQEQEQVDNRAAVYKVCIYTILYI